MVYTLEKIPTEAYEQTCLCVWLAKHNIRHFSVPNDGKRSYATAMKMKRTGLQSGVPDICIPIPRFEYHGLYIEMKRRKGGALSDNQRDWLKFLQLQGYQAQVAHGFIDAKDIVRRYFRLTLVD